MTEALLILGSAVLGALTGILTTSWKARKDLESEYDISLRKDRTGVYRDLWKRLEMLAFYAAPRVTYDDADKLTRSLREWYFQQGGLFLSERTREPYFDVQRALEGILRQERGSDDAQVDEASIGLLRELASRLRTSMTEDVETRVGPRGRWSLPRAIGRVVDRFRPRVDVKVRRYWRWDPKPVPGYRLTIRNLSSRRVIEVEKAWFVPEVRVIPDDPSLSGQVEPKGKWEGWAASAAFGGTPADVGRRGRVRLKTGQEYRSRPAREVPLPDHGQGRPEAATEHAVSPGDASEPR
ncbi:MAG: hypothetical protein ACRDNR_11795 [Gaiellaceae bacterium]